METSIFLAQVLGVYYLTVGVGFVFNGDYYRKELLKMFDNALFMFYGGIMALLLGLLMVHFHNFWTKDWTVVITIIGWIAVVKGVLLIAFPRSLNWFKPLLKSKSSIKAMTILVLLIGAFFAWKGFGG